MPQQSLTKLEFDGAIIPNHYRSYYAEQGVVLHTYTLMAFIVPMYCNIVNRSKH